MAASMTLDHPKDKEPGSAAGVGLHLHPLFTTASPKGPSLFRAPVAE